MLFLARLTWKFASRHNRVHLFDMEALSNRQKVVRTWCALPLLTYKCASRCNGVHFFDIATSKSGSSMVCFATFGFQMCFAPPRGALFRHCNFQKWTEHGVCLPLLTYKCVSCHNRVHFFDILFSKSDPSMWCFDTFPFKTCFAPSRLALFRLSSGQLAPHPPL